MLKLCNFLQLITVLTVAVLADESDPQFLARIQYFNVAEASQYSCTDPGARCEFRRQDFDSVHFGRGQESQILDKAVWAATSPDAVLSLGDCVNSVCEVACNANCTCSTTADATCNMGVAPAPTDAPVAAPLVGPQCLTQRFTNFCPELMQTALPLGNEKWYDCFNFCGGVFDTACRAGEDCGVTTCNNATAAGTYTGEVFGCTVDHLEVQISKPGSSDAFSLVHVLPLLLALLSAWAIGLE